MANAKFVKTAAAVALGTSVVATAVAPSASAATTYKIKSGKLVNAKTGKVIKGYKTYKSVLYKDGKKYTGLRSGKYYKAGVLSTGTYKGVKYKKGVKFTGISTADGKYYKNGVVGTGTYKDVKYKKGLPFTGVSTANGKYYQDGLVLTGANEDGVVYIDGNKDEVAPVITAEDQTVAYDAKDVDVLAFAKVEDNSKEEIKATATITFDGKEVPAIDTTQAGEYTVTYAAQDTNGNKAEKTIKVTVEATDLVAAVAATTVSTIKVDFSKEVTKAEASNFAVANKATGEKQVVKSVKLSDDKKSATLEFYAELAANTTYTVDTTIGEEKSTNEVTVGSLTASKIEVADKKVKAEELTAVEYKVFDETGVDVTAAYPVAKVSFVSPATVTGGQIKLAKGTSTTVKVQVKNDKNEVIAESNTANFSAEEAKVSEIANWTVENKDITVDFTAENFKTNAVVALGTENEKIQLNLKDQFGKEVTTTDAKISYESTNPSVLVVDKATGVISTFANGTAAVKVTVTDAEGKVVLAQKTVNVTVQDAAKASKLVVDKAAVTVSTADDAQKLTATVTDQYGEVVSGAKVNGTVKDAKGEVVADATITETTTSEKGLAEITLPTFATAGTYTIEFTTGADNKVVASTTVTAKAPGAFAKYAVEGLESTIDLYEGTGEVKNVTEIAPKVISTDAEGLKIQKENTTVEVVNPKVGNTETDKKVANSDGKKVVLDTEAEAGDTFQIVVKSGNKVISTSTVTVKDSTPAVNYGFSKYTLNETAGKTVQAVLQAVLLKDSKEVTEAATFEYVTADSDVVPVESTGVLAEGTTTVYVKSVNDVKFETPVKLTVNVAKAAN